MVEPETANHLLGLYCIDGIELMELEVLKIVSYRREKKEYIEF